MASATAVCEVFGTPQRSIQRESCVVVGGAVALDINDLLLGFEIEPRPTPGAAGGV